MRNQGWPINPQYLAGAPLQILHSVNMIYTRRNLIPKFVCISPSPFPGEYAPLLKQEDFILIYWLGWQEVPSRILKAAFRCRAPQTIDLQMNKAPQIDSGMIRPFIFCPCLRRLNEHKSSLELIIAETLLNPNGNFYFTFWWNVDDHPPTRRSCEDSPGFPETKLTSTWFAAIWNIQSWLFQFLNVCVRVNERSLISFDLVLWSWSHCLIFRIKTDCAPWLFITPSNSQKLLAITDQRTVQISIYLRLAKCNERQARRA